jgi:GT2 family glycosyltransferase
LIDDCKRSTRRIWRSSDSDLGTPVTASVIIVSYNARSRLTACLRSLVDHESHDCEIIVVDNASCDGSADFVERAFPQVRVISNRANVGFGAASNLAACHAQGDYLAFLNPDTIVTPGWLERLIAALKAEPQAGMATPQILLLAEPGLINTCGNRVHYTGLTLCQRKGQHRDTSLPVERVAAVSGAACVISKELFFRLGAFDERFFLYMEDTDLSWRARLAGYSCVYVPSSVVYHDYLMRFGPDKIFYQERNRYLMLVNVLCWRTILVLLPALLLAELVTWGFVLLRQRRRAGEKLRAYAWPVRHWRGVRACRRHTQSLRCITDNELLRDCTSQLSFEQADSGTVARVAHKVFDPLFSWLGRMSLALIRW